MLNLDLQSLAPGAVVLREVCLLMKRMVCIFVLFIFNFYFHVVYLYLHLGTLKRSSFAASLCACVAGHLGHQDVVQGQKSPIPYPAPGLNLLPTSQGDSERFGP